MKQPIRSVWNSIVAAFAKTAMLGALAWTFVLAAAAPAQALNCPPGMHPDVFGYACYCDAPKYKPAPPDMFCVAACPAGRTPDAARDCQCDAGTQWNSTYTDCEPTMCPGNQVWDSGMSSCKCQGPDYTKLRPSDTNCASDVWNCPTGKGLTLNTQTRFCECSTSDEWNVGMDQCVPKAGGGASTCSPSVPCPAGHTCGCTGNDCVDQTDGTVLKFADPTCNASYHYCCTALNSWQGSFQATWDATSSPDITQHNTCVGWTGQAITDCVNHAGCNADTTWPQSACVPQPTPTPSPTATPSNPACCQAPVCFYASCAGGNASACARVSECEAFTEQGQFGGMFGTSIPGCKAGVSSGGNFPYTDGDGNPQWCGEPSDVPRCRWIGTNPGCDTTCTGGRVWNSSEGACKCPAGQYFDALSSSCKACGGGQIQKPDDDTQCVCSDPTKQLVYSYEYGGTTYTPNKCLPKCASYEQVYDENEQCVCPPIDFDPGPTYPVGNPGTYARSSAKDQSATVMKNVAAAAGAAERCGCGHAVLGLSEFDGLAAVGSAVADADMWMQRYGPVPFPDRANRQRGDGSGPQGCQCPNFNETVRDGNQICGSAVKGAKLYPYSDADAPAVLYPPLARMEKNIRLRISSNDAANDLSKTTANYQRKIWRCADGAIPIPSPDPRYPFECPASDWTAHACDSITDTNLGNLVKPGTPFDQLINPSLACCLSNMGDMEGVTPGFVKFKCVERHPTASQSFQQYYDEAGGANYAGIAYPNRLFLTDGKRRLVGFFDQSGARCPIPFNAGPFSGQMQDALTPRQLMQVMDWAVANNKAPFNGDFCPTLAQAALEVTCPQNPTDTTSAVRRKTGPGGLIRCPGAADVKVHYRVADLGKSDTTKRVVFRMQDSIGNSAPAVVVDMANIVSRKYGACPSGFTNKGGECVYNVD